MKKLIILGLLGSLAAANSGVKAQAVEQGNMIFDIYYGFPNWYTAVFKNLYTGSGIEEDVKIKGMGPVGLRGEYMVADKIGIGLDIGMNSSSVTYKEADFLDPDKSYEYKFSTQKVGVMVTFNWHFLDNDNLDAYTVLGTGYGKRTFKESTTDPDYDDDVTLTGLSPVSFKLGVGMRYFFTDNIGANLGLGIGMGGLLNFGLSVKI